MSNLGINEDIPALTKVSRLEFGHRRDPARGVRRVIIETSTDCANGSNIAGHRIAPPTEGPEAPELGSGHRHPGTPVPTLIEVYSDQIPAILERVRTDEHVRLREQAQTYADARNKAWAESPEIARVLAPMDEKKRAKFVFFHQPATWPAELAILAPKMGMPPLLYAKVVHPETGEKVDARAWLALPTEEKLAFCLDAPPTEANQADRASQAMADTIARAMLQMEAMRAEKGARK